MIFLLTQICIDLIQTRQYFELTSLFGYKGVEFSIFQEIKLPVTEDRSKLTQYVP